MNKTAKRIILGVTIPAAIAGAVVAGLLIYRNVNVKPVAVYPLSELVMTDYGSDSSVTSGTVSAEGLQKVFLSNTQSVKSVDVQEGQKVKKGDVLISYDTTLKDLEVERSRINAERLELELSQAKKELNDLNNAQPHTTIVIEPGYTVTYTPSETPMLLQGAGTSDDPFIYLFDESDSITGKVLDKILTEAGKRDNGSDSEKKETEPAGDHSADPDAGETSEKPETEPDTDTGEVSDAEPVGSSEADASPDLDDPGDGSVYVVVINREENAMNAPVKAKHGLRIDTSEGRITGLGFFEPNLPENIERYEEQPEAHEEESGSEYTQEELVQLRLSKSKEIEALQRNNKIKKNDYEQKKLEIEDGTVRASTDGVVTKVRTPQDANGEPIVELSAGGAYYVTGVLSEFDLENVHPGDIVTVETYGMGDEGGGTYEGEVVEISDKPATGEDSYSYFNYTEGNSNVTNYPFKVKLPAEADLRDDSYVEIYYQSDSGDDAGVYIMNAFIRRDGGDSYVYAKDDKGLLEKRSVRIGRSLWGSYTQVKNGLKPDDELAFPYGKDVKAGAKTTEGKTEDLYGDMAAW